MVMEEMYDMSIVAHNYGVVFIFGAILLNLVMIMRAKSVQKYRRFNTLFNPIGGTFLGVLIYTGVVMMAAKHLDFTLANIAMIVFAIVLIYLEVKRSSKLKYIKNEDSSGFKLYKKFVYKVLSLEIFILFAISIWMWL
jgi:hypothetical protein